MSEAEDSRLEAGRDSPDVRAFLERHERELCIDTVRTVIARAPGRLDVMGGIADYSGSLVLQWPIAEATIAAVQFSAEARVCIESYSRSDDRPPRRFEASVAHVRELAREGYAAVRAKLALDPDSMWSAYVLGTLLVLMRECAVSLESGLRIRLESAIPEGKGVSSSAALEVATFAALARLYDVALDGSEIARLCQLAENHVVGAPCGIMDQMASALGRRERLMALRCQPAELLGYRELPPGVCVWGIDSGVRHAVSASSYTDVRVGAFMGYRVLAALAGFSVTPGPVDGSVVVDDRVWHGYLANVDAEQFAREFVDRIPVSMEGADFLAQYGGVTDQVARVEPDVRYAVRQPTQHPIEERRRVERFADILDEMSRSSEAGTSGRDARLRELGVLMFESHESYSACGLGSHATDRIVARVREGAGVAGVFGAKITGGGSGGTVAILGRTEAEGYVRRLAFEHQCETGLEAQVFAASSWGAIEHGVLDLGPR